MAAIFLVISVVVHTMPQAGFFAGLEWNWQGKTFELIWLIVLLAALPRWARREVGLRWVRPGTLRPALQVLIGIFLIQMVLTLVLATGGDPVFEDFASTERLLFDMGHTTLVEELLWRGVLLALLDRLFGTPWRFFGAQVGWGLVLTSLGFGLLYGLLFTEGEFQFAPTEILITCTMGLVLGWVRARTGSVWLAGGEHRLWSARELLPHDVQSDGA